MELDGLVLSHRGGGMYRGSDGREYRLAAVDREYRSGARAPVYYLQVMEGGRARYLSGVFYAAPGLYSLDQADALGIKTYYTLRLDKDGGSIRRGRVKAASGAGIRAAL